MSARFEIVTTGTNQHHARYISANGRILWVTEDYERKRGAENAICALTGHFINHRSDGAEVCWPTNRETQLAEVRYVDDREAL